MYTAVILLVILLAVFVYLQSSGYNIVEYSLDSDKDIKPFKFVMLSDLHDTDVTHDKNRRLMESIKSIDPDFVILAGDMITSYLNRGRSSDNTSEFLRQLAASFKVYYGLGNHEQRYMEEPDRFPHRFEDLSEFVQGLGIELLSDGYTDRDGNIRIYGLNIPLENYRRGVTPPLKDGKIEEVFGSCDKNKYNILIAHSPDHFDEYAAWGPDLVLSGHLHGGIIAIPGIGGLISPQLKPFPKYDFGKYTKSDTVMIVSRGIGWHSIPIRIFNKAEIVSVTVGTGNKQTDQGEYNGDQR
ncbi:MAG: metallophosphoesterase [Lachnospiraceae bacterium]|nr:metallophosphoesterase [Lachnospiraceae bacterium]